MQLPSSLLSSSLLLTHPAAEPTPVIVPFNLQNPLEKPKTYKNPATTRPYEQLLISSTRAFAVPSGDS